MRFTEPLENYDHEHQTPRVEDGREYGDLAEVPELRIPRQRRARQRRVAAAARAGAGGAGRGDDLGRRHARREARLDRRRRRRAGGIRDPLARDDRSALVGLRPVAAAAGENVLKGVSTDNRFFAVRSVGKNGARSIPVAAVLKPPRRRRRPEEELGEAGIAAPSQLAELRTALQKLHRQRDAEARRAGGVSRRAPSRGAPRRRSRGAPRGRPSARTP